MQFGADLGATGTNFGAGTSADVEELNKALTAGYGRGGDTDTGTNLGAPLRVESLEQTLKVITFNERHVVFWRDIPKIPAFNTVEEFNQLTSYGSTGGYFVPEGVAPNESDSTYVRKTVQVKYVGSLRKVSHQMTLVRPAHGDVIALETLNGTREILRTVEKALFKGDSACVSQEWDGIEAQFYTGIGTDQVDTNIVDMRGAALSEEVLNEGANIVIQNYGFPTKLYCGYDAMTDLNKAYLSAAGKERVMVGQPNNGTSGFNLQGFQTAGGAFGFSPSVFITAGEAAPAAASGSSGGSLPSNSGVTVDAVAASDTDPNNAFITADAATYYYWIALENRFGVQAATNSATTASNAAVTSGKKVTLTIAGMSGTTATAVRIYRSKTNVQSAAKLVRRIPVVAGASMTWVDRNLFIPGTSTAYLLQVDLDVMSWKQLAPFTKIPLATVDPSIRWMQLLYGTPTLYAPRKIVVYRNIGRA